jgi:hypothetical protein
MQNRLDPVLETGRLRDEPHSFGDDTTTRLGLFVIRTSVRKSARMALR